VAGLAADAGLRYDRRATLGGLGAVVTVSWLYLWHMAAGMDHASMAMAAAPRAADAGALVLTFVMWTVMMAGMMLPSAAPAIVLYGAMVRKNAERGSALPATWTFVGAYLVVWTAFSAGATALQAALEAAALMTPALTLASAGLGALALVAAGVYQLTPLKQACLRKCRNPMELFLTRWRTGGAGAFRMGLEHGAYCLGCCWALMLVVFVAGVMNLAWVALIAAFVFVEKLLPGGRLVSYVAGAVLIASGIFVLTRI
jgi:predicted metal-binding membrane protein